MFLKSIIKNNQVIDLSKNELKIFHYLLSHRGMIISREKLMSYLWDSDMFVDDNTLTVNINRLRKKLEGYWFKRCNFNTKENKDILFYEFKGLYKRSNY